MKVEDFEKAVAALDSNIVLDEMRINKGHVRMCYGHTGCTLIMWDETGQAYTVEYSDGDVDQDTHDMVSDGVYNRDENFDLKFNTLDYIPLCVKISGQQHH